MFVIRNLNPISSSHTIYLSQKKGKEKKITINTGNKVQPKQEMVNYLIGYIAFLNQIERMSSLLNFFNIYQTIWGSN